MNTYKKLVLLCVLALGQVAPLLATKKKGGKAGVGTSLEVALESSDDDEAVPGAGDDEAVPGAGEEPAAASAPSGGTWTDWFKPSKYTAVATTRAVGDASTRIAGVAEALQEPVALTLQQVHASLPRFANVAEGLAASLKPVLKKAGEAIVPLQHAVSKVSTDVTTLTQRVGPLITNVNEQVSRLGTVVDGVAGDAARITGGLVPLLATTNEQIPRLVETAGQVSTNVTRITDGLAPVLATANVQLPLVTATLGQVSANVTHLREGLVPVLATANVQLPQITATLGQVSANVTQLRENLTPVLQNVGVLLAPSQKPGADGPLMLSDITGDPVHAAVPVSHFVAQAKGAVAAQLKEADTAAKERLEQVDSMICKYAKYTAAAVVVGVVAYLTYKYISHRIALAAVPKGLVVVKKENSDVSQLFNEQELGNLLALNGAMLKQKSGMFSLAHSVDRTQAVIKFLRRTSDVACLPSAFIAGCFASPKQHEKLTEILKYLETRKIPLVVLDAETLAANKIFFDWLAVAFPKNTVILSLVGGDVLGQKHAEQSFDLKAVA